MPSVLVIVAVSAVLWLRVVVRLDRHRSAKGTSRRVAGFFLLGMLSVVPTILLYRISFLDFVLPGGGLLGDLLYQLCCVGPIEEFSKFLVFKLLATRFRTVREPVDGMYQAAAVGLGFAVVENLSYGFAYGPGIALARSLVTPLAHMTYACVWGFVYASHAWGASEWTVRSRTAVWTALLPAAFLHGFANFLGNFGPTILVFDVLCAAAAFLVLKRLRAESPFAARNLGRPGEALGAIGASLALDPANPHLHLRAAHFRLRAGDADRAAAHLERYLAARPEDPYGLGLKGAAFVLRGERDAGERLLTRAEAMMRPRTRRAFRTNLRRLLAPGPGRTYGGFDESMLRTWLVVSELNRERIDPRPRPPALTRAAARAAAVPRPGFTRA
jgi:RsiW-degrading membrane proteinase PrsW (M82 family)